ncbi:MAG: alpha-galactosidase [Candidatus Latescibacteria bacterium]|nr:alpha-galactosidase [Candidatus Latescibacterota bacterium]
MKTSLSSTTSLIARIAPGDIARRIIAGPGFAVGPHDPAVWQLEESNDHGDGSFELRYVFPDAGLEATCTLCLDQTRRAAAYTVRITNTRDVTSQPLEVVRPFTLEFGPGDPWYRVLTAGGGTTESFYPPEAYRTQESVINAGSIAVRSGDDGRSSNRNLPFLMFTCGVDEQAPGLFVGLEWSATWTLALQCRGRNGEASVIGGPLARHVTLYPGESLTLPTVHLGFFEGGLDAGTNACRRYLYEAVSARYDGQPVVPPVSYDHWFGIDNRYDEQLLRREADRAAELGVEFFVVDAAWFAGGFPHGVGNWLRIDTQKFPNGLEPFAEYVRSKGMHFGLWFEVERGDSGTDIVRDYPDWFVQMDGGPFHINLALREVQDYLIDMMGGYIKRLDIRWSRWDYNIGPIPFWQKVDPTGKVQFRYIQGLYRVLDTLMREHPKWFIECCASGGRRLDIGTMRRAHSCWFSDHSSDPHICRYMQARANRFLPGHFLNSSVMVDLGNGDAGYSDLSILSRMVGKLAFDGDIASWSPKWTARVRHWTDVYRRIRHLLVGDFYQLLPQPATDADWDAVQFGNADEGIVFVFRYRGITQRCCLRLRALRPDVTYRVEDCGDGKVVTSPGRDLLSWNWSVELRTNDARLFRYAEHS